MRPLPWLSAALLVALAVPATASASHAGPLAAQWHFDAEGPSNNEEDLTLDSSGHGLHAITGNLSLTLADGGRFGRHLSDGNTQILAANSSAEIRTQRLTVLTWVRSAAPPGTLKYIAAQGDDGAICSAPSYGLYTGVFAGDGLQFFIRQPSGFGVFSPVPGNALWDGQWHMVAGTFDGDAVRLYVDGAQVGTGTPAPGATIDYGVPGNKFGIDGYIVQACGSADFPGGIDEMRVYNRALTATELARLAAAPGPDPPVLVADGDAPPPGPLSPPALPPVATPPVVAPPPRGVAPHFVSATSRQVAGAVWMSGAVSDVPAGVTIRKYSWDFNGDGSFEADCGGEAPAASRTFSSAGTKQVVLRITDHLGRTSTVQQPIVVTREQVNRARTAVFTCEAPLGPNQPDSKDCIKTFSFGIVEVNGRGSPDQCFRIERRPALVLLAKPSQVIRSTLAFDYLAKIAGPVALNGLPVPVPSDRITEYDSGKLTVSIGTMPIFIPVPGGSPIRVADVPLEYAIKPTKGRFKLPPLKTGGVAIKAFGGLKLGGGIEIHLVKRAAEVFISLKLPDVFSFGYKREAEGRVALRTTNVGGFEFDGARISQIPQVLLGPLFVTNLFFDYRRTGDIWRGGANFQLAAVSPVEIKASPPPPDYGFGMRGGRFDYAGGGVAFPNPPRPQVFPGVGLTEIGGAIGVKPVRFTGRMGIDVGGLFVIDGSAFIGLASEQQPYDFPEEYAPPGLGFLAGRTLDSVSIALGGEAKIKVPVVGELPLINSYIFYAYPDYAEFGGGFKFSVLERFSVNGNVGGFIAIGSKKFNLEGQVQGCADIEITKFCLTVGAVVSSKGIGFCTIVPVPTPLIGSHVPVPAGIGYEWGKSIDINVFTCDIGPYREARPAARGAQVGESFTLAPGLPSAMVRIRGRGGVPSVVLNGPAGERIAVGGPERGAISDRVVAIPQTPESTLLVGLKKPAAGRWTVTARDGSAPIASVAAADGLPDPRVSARVSGRGSRRVLSYVVGNVAGQRVTFVERGARTWRLIGEARGSRGSIEFAPAPGRQGGRRIEALVERGGVTVKRLAVARFTAPRAARPATPRRLRVRRSRGGLVISWRRARGAVRYGVTVQLSTSQRIFRATRGTKVFIEGIHRQTRGTVRVGGLRGDGIGGREARRGIPRR